jgi:predicted O-methyltransferase YrrM
MVSGARLRSPYRPLMNLNDKKLNDKKPVLVLAAEEAAQMAGFTQSCIPVVGQLLAVLAGTALTRVAEAGAGHGVGTVWLASGLRPSAKLVSVELDAVRAEAAGRLFPHPSNVEVLCGDWRDVLPRFAPFDLLFLDGGSKADVEASGAAAIELLAPGGLVLIDDLTPVEHWPEEWRGQRDLVREFWLSNPAVRATEVRTTATTAALIASRRA